jgi:DNA-binding SARP family transcriptional activator/tetratricopeptide (TPR) repeat protein
MRFRLLGPVEVDRAGGPVDLGGPRQRAVLAALLLRANETVGVSRLCADVWDLPPRAAESNLRTYVARLRSIVDDPDEAVERLGTRQGYRLTVGRDELDVTVFEDLAERGRVAMAAGDHALAAGALGRARSLWRGGPFEGADEGPLLRAEATRLTERYLTVVEQHARARIELGEDVVGELQVLVGEHPTREELPALLMLALYRAGRQAEALAVYRATRDRLVAELGVEPGAELSSMQQRILAADPGLDPTVVALRQLPMDIAEFTGRGAELAQLRARVEHAAGESVVIAVVTGMAGVGKTRLAVRAAHDLVRRGWFTEVQLWADLRGFDPVGPPAEPAGVLAGFLGLLGVPPRRLPPDLAGRAALYRDRLAGRRALVLLDNAADEAQVRPLLPGGPGSLVLVTSRHTLSDLDGALPVPLDVLTENEAVTLLARVAGERRVVAEPDEAARVVRLCGCLPIAVTLAAQRLRNRPVWSVRDLARRLDAETGRLGELHGRSRAVRATFELSYRMLSDQARRVFRLIGLHPGEEVGADSTAALADLPPRETELVLDELVDEHLLQEVTPGRFRPHDLLRLYAREVVAGDPERDAAARRLHAWYAHAAETAAALLDPDRRSVPAAPDAPPGFPAAFPTRADALAWCETERHTLVAVVRAAVTRGDHSVAWRLACSLLTFYYLRKYWDDWLATHGVALEVTTDPTGRARLLNGMGVAYSDLGRIDDAIAAHTEACELFRDAGDLLGAAWNLNNLGVALHDVARFEEAAACHRDALPLFRETGDAHGESIGLNNLGDAYRRLGRTDEAFACLSAALRIQRHAGDRAAQRFTYWAFGDLRRDGGDEAAAVADYREALAICRDLDDRRCVAKLLVRIGDVLDTRGAVVDARAHWREAHGIYVELADPDLAEVESRLARESV